MWDAVSSVLPKALAAAAGPSIPVVVITGLVLVFFILVLLVLILIGEGKLFESLDRKKQQREQENAARPQAPAVQSAAPAAVPAPAVQDGIPTEVVAAIAAAVHEMEGGRYVLRSVSVQQTGRSQWGLAGVISNTEPF